MKFSKIRFVGLFAALFMLVGLFGAATPSTANAIGGGVVSNRNYNEGSNNKKSVKYLMAYDSANRITVVKPGKYIPYKSKKISVPSGYLAYAYNGYRGYQCARTTPKVLKKTNRKWTVKRATAENVRRYC